MTDPSEQFKTEFNTDIYLSDFVHSFQDQPYLRWCGQQFHDMFQTGMVKGAHLVDIGTGPSIVSVISAAPHCGSIILSDICSSNRDTLHRWLVGKSEHIYDSIFNYFLEKEGNGEKLGAMESRLRGKIAAILPVDLRLEDPFKPCLLPKFNVVTSSLCMEGVPRDYAEYKKIAARVTSLLENGGYLVICGTLNETSYHIGGVLFKRCAFTADSVKNAWTENGLQIIKWEEFQSPGETESVIFFFMCAQKAHD